MARGYGRKIKKVLCASGAAVKKTKCHVTKKPKHSYAVLRTASQWCGAAVYKIFYKNPSITLVIDLFILHSESNDKHFILFILQFESNDKHFILLLYILPIPFQFYHNSLYNILTMFQYKHFCVTNIQTIMRNSFQFFPMTY